MPSKAKLTKAADITVAVREIDFVTRFGKNWDALRDIMGIMRPIRKAPGTKLTSFEASMKDSALQGGSSVGEGEEIPYTEFQVAPVAYEDIGLEKYAKATSIEAVAKYGAAVAVQKTDEAFLNELQSVVMKRFYDFLKTGTLAPESAPATWQMALAQAKGLVLEKFAGMRKNVTEVVGFANIMDLYNYVGAADITVQTQFGLTYVKNFLGYSTLFLCPEADIPSGTVIATPVENIDLYYIDPSDSEFARLGLEYRTDGVTNLCGFKAIPNYGRAIGESYCLMGLKLWAEFIDGIAYVEIGATPTFTAVDKTGEGYSSKNPKTQGWYELVNTRYFPSEDTTVDADKTYYTKGA